MNELDQFLDELGLHDATNRQAIRRQIEAYAFELAIATLLEAGSLSEAEKTQLQEVFATQKLDDATLETLFATPERQKALQDAMTVALQATVEAAQTKAL